MKAVIETMGIARRVTKRSMAQRLKECTDSNWMLYWQS
jgi:hypothetical protein